MSFHRNPSKVWWASEDNADWNQRANSSSPRSQDSGFSDTETSLEKRKSRLKRLDIEKDRNSNVQNLSQNVKEKPTPDKKFNNQKVDVCHLDTPLRNMELEVRSEPANKFKFIKHSPKISRNLFRSARFDDSKRSIDFNRNQYSKDIRSSHDSSIGNNVTYDDVDSSWSSVEEANVTVPVLSKQKKIEFNISAPAILTEEEGITSFNSLSSSIQSDTDSELECLFAGSAESPKHTSTPKVFTKTSSLRPNKKKAMNLLLKYQHERVPPTTVQHVIEDGTALKQYLDEARHLYEAECMTTLQSKSIAAELAEKVSNLATIATTSLRVLLENIRIIENEFDNLKSQPKHRDALIQSVTGLIKEFTDKYSIQNKTLKKYCEDLKLFKLEEHVTKLHKTFHTESQKMLEREVSKFVDSIEDPASEMDLRGKLTGLTWISLRNPNILEMLTRCTVIQTLVVLCEKCDGSSVRALSLRALSTLCCNAAAIKLFERASGVQSLCDIINETSRPEPERSEAVALLAQITAPWIEDIHWIHGLNEHSRDLIYSLTSFLEQTKCCQNLLLCTAALANLTTMDSKSIKYILHQNTIRIVIDAVRRRGPMASVYLLEQVAILIANVSALEMARLQLTEDEVPKALLCFLQTRSSEEDVVKRLQQKSIIALSRLCVEPEAARQVVGMQGVGKLVRLCREKSARYDSDAVLVATLATLRRIAEACGASVIDAQDAQELVEPRLLDSFLAYSAQNESLV